MTAESENLRTETTNILLGREVTLAVTGRLTSPEFVIGGPVEMELSITNQTPVKIFYLAGQAGERPAYLKFFAQLQRPHRELRDPYPDTPLEPQGLFASLYLDPEHTEKRTIVLNQFLAFEDIRPLIPEGEHAILHIHYRCLMIAGRGSVHSSEPEPVEGELQVRLMRNEKRLHQEIDSLAGKLFSDSTPIASDPIGRVHAITALTSLRIPEIEPYLRRLENYPSVEVRNMTQRALREMKK